MLKLQTLESSQTKNWRQRKEDYWEFRQKVQANPRLQKIEYERCRRSLPYWLETYVWTLDEHKQPPLRLFPLQEGCPEREYLLKVIEEWEKNFLYLIEKSRKMVITWLMVAIHLWITQFQEGRLVFFQSRKEEDANATLDRAKFIYNYEPFWLKRYSDIRKYCHFEWPTRHSHIWAVPQGPDTIRQYTATAIFSDEMAFQEQAEAAFIAAKPTIDGGGRFTGVSSANPGFFQRMCRDQM